MKQKLILWAVGGTIIFGVGYLGFSGSGPQVEPSQNVLMEQITGNTAIEEMFGGKDALTTVAHPDNVEVYRIDPESEQTGEGLKLDEFKVTSGPITAPRDVASRLATLLASPKSYWWDAAPACVPKYGLRVKFDRATDRIDILLCLECNISLVFRNGQYVSHGHFFYAHAALVHVVQELFPDDRQIQSLTTD